ncbi:MAG TPA: Uma2 family endonuclease [Candidatus Elarobacter sp.]
MLPVEIPETTPPTELIDGRLVQKTGGELRHQTLELRWTLVLRAWSGQVGEALHEWRHEFRAPGHSFASLVPDVAYLSRDSLEALGPAASEKPPRAPDVAVEILSAGESERHLTWKIGAYLAAGTRVVFVVDAPKRTVIAHSRDGVERFGPGDTVRRPAMSGFAYAIDAMFDGLYLG